MYNFPSREKTIDIPEKISTEYREFGTLLLDDDDGAKVCNIVKEFRDNAKEINAEILRQWIQGKGKQPVTWRTLIEVLHCVGLITLAEDIRTGCQGPKHT